MKKIRTAIVGYGNIGKAVLEALQASPDFEVAGVVRRAASLGKNPKELQNISITSDIKQLGEVHVAILCLPTRNVLTQAKQLLAMGICTVDSYDIHQSIWEHRQELEPIAKANKAVSIVAAGWDPGSDSVVRALLLAAAPQGISYTNFGPGMSMGHTVAAKAIEGVKNALSTTIPLGTGIHRRVVYVELQKGHSLERVASAIKTDSYFAHDETHVIEVDNVETLLDTGHGVSIVRKGVSGVTSNQQFQFNMRINNPALTAQIMVSCARATLRLAPGAYTLIEIPMVDLLSGSKEQHIRQLV